jgi:hypothetical protein
MALSGDVGHPVIQRDRILSDQLPRMLDARRAQVIGDRWTDVGTPAVVSPIARRSLSLDLPYSSSCLGLYASTNCLCTFTGTGS